MYDKQFVFIVGAPRSGTSWLQNMMVDHPQVVEHRAEVTTFCRYVRPMESTFRKEFGRRTETTPGRGLGHFLEREDFHAIVSRFLEGVYAKLLDGHPDCTHYVEKVPSNATAVDLINKYIPDAKFLHLIRDGRDVAVSWETRIVREQRGAGKWNIAHGANRWKGAILGARQASAYDGRYLEIRYEDLVARCEEELQRVFEFCGLPADAALVHQIAEASSFSKRAVSSPTPGVSRGNGKATWEQLMSPLDRYTFDRVAGSLLQELGYADRTWWYGSGTEKTLVTARWYLRRARQRLGQNVVGVLQRG